MTLQAVLVIMAMWMTFNSPEETRSGPWELVKNTNGVQTFYRWTTNEKGISFRERKGEMIIRCTMQEAVRVISDTKSTKEWMTSVDEIYDLERISPNEWYTYTLFNIPWPLNNRDLISFNKLNPDHGNGAVTIDITCKDRFAPLKNGVTRLTDYKAVWHITRQDEKNISISFTAASSAPPSLPRYIQDPIIEKIFHNNLIRLKEILDAESNI